MAITVGLISLGCSKNRVDSELILGHLRKAGFRITADEAEAEVIIIKTCGFIESIILETISFSPSSLTEVIALYPSSLANSLHL